LLGKSKQRRKEQEKERNKYVFSHDFCVCFTNIANKNGTSTIRDTAFNFFKGKKTY